MSTPDPFTEAYSIVTVGDLTDSELERLSRAIAQRIRMRRAATSVSAAATFRAGQRVRVKATARLRPTYCNGHECTVVSVKLTRVLVSGLPGRFSGQHVTVPAHALEAV